MEIPALMTTSEAWAVNPLYGCIMKAQASDTAFPPLPFVKFCKVPLADPNSGISGGERRAGPRCLECCPYLERKAGNGSLLLILMGSPCLAVASVSHHCLVSVGWDRAEWVP